MYGIHVHVFTDHKSLQCVFTELSLHQRRGLEFLMDYNMSVHYHRGKTNVVEDDLRRLYKGSLAHVEEDKGTSEGCSQACSLRSSAYEHIRQWCNSLDCGRIVFCTVGEGKVRQ